MASEDIIRVSRGEGKLYWKVRGLYEVIVMHLARWGSRVVQWQLYEVRANNHVRRGGNEAYEERVRKEIWVTRLDYEKDRAT